jgi:hypothetical protein
MSFIMRDESIENDISDFEHSLGTSVRGTLVVGSATVES